MIESKDAVHRVGAGSVQNTLSCLGAILASRTEGRCDVAELLREVTAVVQGDASILVGEDDAPIAAAPPSYTVTHALARWLGTSSLRETRTPTLLRSSEDWFDLFAQPWATEAGVRAVAILPTMGDSRCRGHLLVLWRNEPPALGDAELWALSLAAGVLLRPAQAAAGHAQLTGSRLQRAHGQRMEAVGRLSGGVVHDLNNLLTVITGSVFLLQRSSDEISSAKATVNIGAAAERATALTRKLLALARPDDVEPERFDLNQQLVALQSMLSHAVRDDIELKFDLDPGSLPIVADVTYLEQVILNLVLNAADAIRGPGVISLTTQREVITFSTASTTRTEPGVYATIRVRDSGCGMDEATLARAFEPYFTTKPAGKGTGLGLATARDIVHDAHGTIHATSCPGDGTIVNIRLPLATAAADTDTGAYYATDAATLTPA